ncbi:hypothetical protein [Methanobrevibacter olleyae]|uniref:Uncharacterized protein n=1 Tax=Methanobrevibacter olleyae TaxID=294671 RepID=A0A126R2N8_METOL|nr:hypothetical protein [Methanobrevibacter olleyae]AMK16306.1 hypothetical protein YLM1_1751 [Methanobrevibacter olleyae]
MNKKEGTDYFLEMKKARKEYYKRKKVDDIARCKDCTNSYQCGSFSESYCKLQSSDKMIKNRRW